MAQNPLLTWYRSLLVPEFLMSCLRLKRCCVTLDTILETAPVASNAGAEKNRCLGYLTTDFTLWRILTRFQTLCHSFGHISLMMFQAPERRLGDGETKPKKNLCYLFALFSRLSVQEGRHDSAVDVKCSSLFRHVLHIPCYSPRHYFWRFVFFI